MLITREIYTAICQTLGGMQPEQGGIIGGKCGVVTAFCFDKEAERTSTAYVPSVNRLNKVIELWHEQGIELMGIIHSHSNRDARLSGRDLNFAHKIVHVNSSQINEILFPLVLPAEEGEITKIVPYRITKDSIKKENIKIKNIF